MKAYLFFVSVVIALVTWSCQGNKKHTSDFDNLQRSLVSPDSTLMNMESSDLMVYYFHNTRRCATCNAVESVTIEALKEYYGDKVIFTSLNLEEESTKTLAKSMKIAGQSLVICHGSEQIDLTNEAFMYARKNPNKLKEKLKATIDPIL